MSFYYRISDVIERVTRAQDQKNPFASLVPVAAAPPENFAHPEDIFTLASNPKILDLRGGESAYQLAQMLDEVPLYSINLELIMDVALTERHANKRVMAAVTNAFGRQPLPNTLKPESTNEDHAVTGGLRHPMLGHINKLELSKLYISFLSSLERGQDIFGFERNIIGKHPERFLERFDGYATAVDAKIKAQILIAFGMRRDHNPSVPMELHVQNGDKRARRMAIDEPHELVWAWLEAEGYQSRRCEDIDMVMRLKGLPKTPNWVRTDMFSCLEREAMKQFFAQTLRVKDPEYKILAAAPTLRTAVKINAEGQVDPLLQKLLGQALSPGATYTGAAAEFGDIAAKRALEGKKAGI